MVLCNVIYAYAYVIRILFHGPACAGAVQCAVGVRHGGPAARGPGAGSRGVHRCRAQEQVRRGRMGAARGTGTASRGANEPLSTVHIRAAAAQVAVASKLKQDSTPLTFIGFNPCTCRYEPVGISNLCWAFATLRFYPTAQGSAVEAAGDGSSSASIASAGDPTADFTVGRGLLDDDMGLGGEHFGLPFYDDLATIHVSSSNRGRSNNAEHCSVCVSPGRQTDDSDLYGAEGCALCDGLYGALERLAAGHVRDMSQQQLANTAWGFVVAGRGRAARQLLGDIARRAGELAEGASASAGAGALSLQPDVSNHRRGRRHPHQPRLDPHAVSVLAWSLSAARQDVSPLLRAVAGVSGVARPDQAGAGSMSQGDWDDSSSSSTTSASVDGADPDGSEADPRSQPGGSAASGGGLGAFSDQDLSMLCIAHHRACRAAAAAARREAGRAVPRGATGGARGRRAGRAMGRGSGAEAEGGAGEVEAQGVGGEGGAPGPYCPELVWAVRDEVIRRAHRMDMQVRARVGIEPSLSGHYRCAPVSSPACWCK